MRVERIVLPAVLASRRDHVDVAVEQERLAATGSRQPRGELRATLESEALDRQRVTPSILGRRLPEIDLRAAGPQPVGECLLKCRLLARRILGAGPARGVVGDQLAGERNDVVTPCGEAVDQRLLVCVEALPVQGAAR